MTIPTLTHNGGGLRPPPKRLAGCLRQPAHLFGNHFRCCLSYSINSRSEGFALTEYDIPGCVEDGAWMPWENSSVAVVVVAVAHLGGKNSAFPPKSNHAPGGAHDLIS